MIFAVAAEHGMSPSAADEEPAVLIVLAFAALLERERIQNFRDRMARWESAFYAALAFHEPSKLDAEHNRILDDYALRAPQEERRRAADEEREAAIIAARDFLRQP